jgi:hypothetical protein
VHDEKLRAAAARGRRFRELVDGDDGLFAIFTAVERSYIETMLGTSIDDTATREQVYHRASALRDIKSAIEIVIAEGNGAAAVIKKLSKGNR